MKSIKMFGLAALAALMAMAFVGASSAMAGTTQLCSSDTVEAQEACKAVTHVHESTLAGAKAKLLSSVINVECDALFLGDTLGEGAPLVIHGHFTYTNCGSCEVTEESEDSLIEVLRTAHELAAVTGNGEVRVHCGFFINCVYDGENLSGHGLGPLLSSETNGSVTLSEQTTHRVSGFCPETAKLDITTTPLAATYIRGPLLHYCVEYEHNTNGRYKDSKCTEKVASGPYDLVIGEPGLKVGEMVCVHLNVTKTGLWEGFKNYSECEKDSSELSKSLYELGKIVQVQ